jgi:phage regulator Rha-like protein
VAELVGKRHADLLRDIGTYIGHIEKGQNAILRFDDINKRKIAPAITF